MLLLDEKLEEELDEDAFRPSYLRDTINSFTHRAFAKRINKPPYDQRHEDAIFKKCHIAVPHFYKDPEQNSFKFHEKTTEAKRRNRAMDAISRTIDFNASV